MSTIVTINYTEPDGARKSRRLCGLAPAGGVPAVAADASAQPGRRARVVADAVPRPAPHRARPADSHEATGRDAGVRRLERHRARGSAGIARPGPPAAGADGSTGEGARPHSDRGAVADRVDGADDVAARLARPAVGARSAHARPPAHSAPRRVAATPARRTGNHILPGEAEPACFTTCGGASLASLALVQLGAPHPRAVRTERALVDDAARAQRVAQPLSQ